MGYEKIETVPCPAILRVRNRIEPYLHPRIDVWPTNASILFNSMYQQVDAASISTIEAAPIGNIFLRFLARKFKADFLSACTMLKNHSKILILQFCERSERRVVFVMISGGIWRTENQNKNNVTLILNKYR